MRDAQKVLEKTFSFLEKEFTKNTYSRNSEINVVYTNKSIEILVGYDLGTDNKYHIWVTIEKNGTSKNLLNCYELFEKTQLDEFRSQIIEEPVEEQVRLYRDFISHNILKLR